MITNSSAGPCTKSLQKLTSRWESPDKEHPESIPEKEFVIWFTARTGSTWLASLLFSAGFPKPAEYFHPNKILRRAAYLGINNWGDYVNSIKQKRTRSGVFGHEMTFQFWDMLKNEGDALLDLDFSGPSVVLFRENIVLQAISIYLAVTTGKWHRYEGTKRSESMALAAYDEKKIRSYIEYIHNLESGLRESRDVLLVDTKYLSYEELTRHSSATVIAAFEKHIGFMADRATTAHSFHTRMGSGLNKKMYERFLGANHQWVTAIQKQRSWLFDAMDQTPLINTGIAQLPDCR